MYILWFQQDLTCTIFLVGLLHSGLISTTLSCCQFTVNQNIPQRIWKILFLYFGPFNSECSNSFEITYLWLKIDFKLYVVLQVILEYKWSSCSTVTRFLGPEKTHISWNSIPASCEKNMYLSFFRPDPRTAYLGGPKFQ